MDNGILYISLPGFKPFPASQSLRLISGTAEVISVTDESSARTALQNNQFKIVISNAPHYGTMVLARKHNPGAVTILVTDLPMRQYSANLDGEDATLIDHVIANRLRHSGTVHELRITIAKLMTKDIFGIEKYLLPDTPTTRGTITGTKDREVYNHRIMEYVEKCRLGQHMAKLAFGIAEELMMNVIYDAPVAAGRTHYLDQPRENPIELQPDEYGEINFACDGETLAIGVSDPFGTLAKDKLMQYSRKVLKRKDATDLIDTKKGGAGLGFFKILYSSHGIVANVAPKTKTEVIALIDVKEQLRDFAKMARSIHYFST